MFFYLQIKCHNVIVLTATNVAELDLQWHCLIELSKSSDLLLMMEPFVSKRLSTKLSDVSIPYLSFVWNIYSLSRKLIGANVCLWWQVEAAQPLTKLCLEFPDLYICKSFLTVCSSSFGYFSMRDLFILSILVGCLRWLSWI